MFRIEEKVYFKNKEIQTICWLSNIRTYYFLIEIIYNFTHDNCFFFVGRKKLLGIFVQLYCFRMSCHVLTGPYQSDKI
jgi:hypothetical protein